jgi:hypothetical protein
MFNTGDAQAVLDKNSKTEPTEYKKYQDRLFKKIMAKLEKAEKSKLSVTKA